MTKFFKNYKLLLKIINVSFNYYFFKLYTFFQIIFILNYKCFFFLLKFIIFFLILNPSWELLKIHNENKKIATVQCVKAEIESSTQYGCIYIRGDEDSGVVDHYVEKPESFVSTTISCGIYIFNVKIIEFLKARIMNRFTLKKENEILNADCIWNFWGKIGDLSGGRCYFW